jgi:hypothetical protein
MFRDHLTPEEEAEVEWEVPQTEADVQRMMAELRAVQAASHE